MSDNALALLSTFLEQGYRLLDSVIYPGTGWNILQLMLSAFLIVTAVNLIKFLFMLPSGGGQGDYGTGGNNGNIKVDEKRKNDTK